jgi:multidrug efflux system membrane fusion protein
LNALGAVTPSATVTVKSHVDGELLSVNFKEGEMVQAGQTLATIDPRPYQLQLEEAKGEWARERAHLAGAEFGTVVELYASLKLAKAKVDAAKLQLSYTEIHSPITGVAGLRLVDAGNIVHATDSGGIVVINQLQPISVIFAISEDQLPKVMAHIKDGLAVEAWSRNLKTRLATGRLEAVDNQIDTATGTVKLKSVFDNKDDALFPNQFVNVRLLIGTN